MGVTGGTPLGFDVGARGAGGTLKGLDLGVRGMRVRLKPSPSRPHAACPGGVQLQFVEGSGQNRGQERMGDVSGAFCDARHLTILAVRPAEGGRPPQADCAAKPGLWGQGKPGVKPPVYGCQDLEAAGL